MSNKNSSTVFEEIGSV